MTTMVLRKHTRFKRLIPVRYLKDGSVAGSGIMTDLSMNGTKITGDTPVIVGMMLALQIFIPGDSESSWIEHVTVQWVSGSEFGVAFEMIHSEESERMALARMVKALHSSEGVPERERGQV